VLRAACGRGEEEDKGDRLGKEMAEEPAKEVKVDSINIENH